MAPNSAEEQFAFLISCIRNSSDGRINFEEVRKECNIVTKGAAAKRYERMMKQYGIHHSQAQGTAEEELVIEKPAKEKAPKASKAPKAPKAPKAAAKRKRTTAKNKDEEHEADKNDASPVMKKAKTEDEGNVQEGVTLKQEEIDS